ncbi:hypothetical protein ACQCVL_17030 [Bacillus thuringiensis]|uniref:hypothetical protein n=1 Tax=Bacillus thuringiensis TaxID=1428 RepID=UPI003CE79BC3
MKKRGDHVIIHSGKRKKQREVPLNSTVRLEIEEYLVLSDISKIYSYNPHFTISVKVIKTALM